ncbi:MAG: uncharacterized protein KVP18_002972 [Porospora cf. gigantea A]|uniref:uncharacterized protein n=2 Tax=Porospora cf. gigantea A TaxID=2853593 RepID=UPI00355A3208|nr:MAG: hypothetical protein KVP18_002972 [Porospora cf. gigantea A]
MAAAAKSVDLSPTITETEGASKSPVVEAHQPVTKAAPVKKKFEFGQKRQKKAAADAPKRVEEAFVDGSGVAFVKGQTYGYEVLLDRVQLLISTHNPGLQGSRKIMVKPPEVSRVGSKRVAWTNFAEICKALNRTPDHVYQFVLSELGTVGSVAADGRHLVLKGRYGQKHIESLLRKYITEYVSCYMCKSPNTELVKDSRTRLFNIKCDACGASRSVTTIRSGFHAVSRGERMRARA